LVGEIGTGSTEEWARGLAGSDSRTAGCT